MNRKQFILKPAMSAFAITAIGQVMRAADGNFKGDCATTNDILGPFYRPDAPLRSDLTTSELEGVRIHLRGRVMQSDCTTPIAGAMVEIWHCNAKGEYDNTTSDFAQRARWITDEQGAYSFKTILPGKYLNGELYRPSHIHYRVTAPGSPELISQIYFEHDPHIAKDPWASLSKARERILPLQPQDTDGSLLVWFDVYAAA